MRISNCATNWWRCGVAVIAAAMFVLIVALSPAAPSSSHAQLTPIQGTGGNARNTIPPDRNTLSPSTKQEVPAHIRKRRIVGIEAIEREVGEAIPTGRGIPLCHVEGMAGDYLPRRSLPEFRGVTFVASSGPSKSNGHTTATARTIYGENGMAPGITDVHCYASPDWLGSGYLNAWSDRPPKLDDRRVFTHSWISLSRGPITADILRRVDYLVDAHNAIVVVGVNNGRDTPVPSQLASAYNVIAVGVRNGDNSGGYTVFEGSGRCKPDIVSIGGKTSFSTPTVAALAARLLETADRMAASDPTSASAKRSQVIKAVLLAGAQKRDGWKPEEGHPLDSHLGAGFARFDYSYDILTAGPQAAGKIDPADGWNFAESPAGEQVMHYEFTLDKPRRDCCFILTWNRRIGSGGKYILPNGKVLWDSTPRLANFDLHLIQLDAGVGPAVIEESRSRVDNVEHIYRRALPAGKYQLVVHRLDAIDEPWEYALAWRSLPFGQHKQEEEEQPIEEPAAEPEN